MAMGRTRPAIDPRRKSSTLHYQTFPTKPPTSRGRPLSESSPSPPRGNGNGDDADDAHGESPLPTTQLAVLAVIALAEQTALNSISPYLPEMASTFPQVKPGQVGLYVGLIASSFAAAQFATNFFWGWLSDRIGRKPVILIGTGLTLACFIAFGFCRTLAQAIVVQMLMGFVNGNAGVVSTCLGEITDRSNQSKAFTYLPVIYGLGAITGPIVGGLLVLHDSPFHRGTPNPYPYLLPNLFSAVVLGIDLVICMLFLEESLEEAGELPPLGKRVGNLFTWLWQFTSSTRPTYIRRFMGRRRRQSGGHLDRVEEEDEDENSSADVDSEASGPRLFPRTNGENLRRDQVFNRDTILLLVTYFIFQLANISYNSLYPIFGEERPPTGRNLSPEEIGLSLAFAGVITILFQIGIYGKIRDQIGNKTTYRVSLAAFAISFLLMPWVGYKEKAPWKGLGSGKGWLWAELGAILVLKTVASVGGLTSALLLITNSAPNHSVLGTLNGLAQTLSAAGRAVGPFISGALFTLATKVQPKGEALAFGVFAGVTFIGFLMSFGIRGEGLEAEGWSESDEEGEDDEEGDDVEADGEGRSADEGTSLLRRN